jgi:hypothetical protein
MFFNYINMSSYGPNSSTPSASLPPNPATQATQALPPNPEPKPSDGSTMNTYNIGGYTITLPIIQPWDDSTISTDSNNPTLGNLNIKETIEAHKDSHRFIIKNLPANLVLGRLAEHRFNSDGCPTGFKCEEDEENELHDQYYVPSDVDEDVVEESTTQEQNEDVLAEPEATAIKNHLSLAQCVPQGYGLALTDSFGKLHHIYQQSKFFTINNDGKTYAWATSDTGNLSSPYNSGNQSNPKKSTVTNQKFIKFFNRMKTLATNFPSLPDDQPFKYKVLDIGEELGYIIITTFKVRLNENSEMGYVTSYSGFKQPFKR